MTLKTTKRGMVISLPRELAPMRELIEAFFRALSGRPRPN